VKEKIREFMLREMTPAELTELYSRIVGDPSDYLIQEIMEFDDDDIIQHLEDMGYSLDHIQAG